MLCTVCRDLPLVQTKLINDTVLYAIYGINRLRRQSNEDVFRALPYWGLMGVGIASAAFHMNLKYHTQMSQFIHYLPLLV